MSDHAVNEAFSSTAETLLQSIMQSDSQVAPQWMHNFVDFRQRLFLKVVEPVIVTLLGPVETDEHEKDVFMLSAGGGEYVSQEIYSDANDAIGHGGGGLLSNIYINCDH